MGAFAGWLRHPAHAPYHHYENRRDYHCLELPAKMWPVNRADMKRAACAALSESCRLGDDAVRVEDEFRRRALVEALIALSGVLK